MYRRMMVPLDGSELAQTALSHALDLCRGLNATLVLLHVHVARAGSLEAARRYLDYIKIQNASLGVPIEIVVRKGEVAESILQAVEELQIDLVVMATHGRSGIQRVVYGSVAEQVLRGSDRPVLLVRVPGAPIDVSSSQSLESSSQRKLSTEP